MTSCGIKDVMFSWPDYLNNYNVGSSTRIAANSPHTVMIRVQNTFFHKKNFPFHQILYILRVSFCITGNPNGEVYMNKAIPLLFSTLLFLALNSEVAAQNDETYSDRFDRIFEHYMNTKDGLVHNRHDLAKAWAERLETSFSTTPDGIFQEDEIPDWHGLRGVLVQAAGDIVDAETIGDQRKSLAELSNGLKDMIEHFGNPGETIYVLQCQYFGEDDLDAIWLHRTDRIANPYHGPENINCGEVIGEL